MATGDTCVVLGMWNEDNDLGKRDNTVAIWGLEGPALTSAIEGAVAGGCTRILSVGTAGALNPALKGGEVCVGVGFGVVSIGSAGSAPVPPVSCDSAWSESIRRMTGATPVFITWSDTTVATASQKTALRNRTGADAVDLESITAACVAAKHHIPFGWLRVISDTADQDIPPAALAALTATGTLDIGAVIASLAADDAQLPALLALADSSSLALNALPGALLNLGVNYGAPS